MQSAMANLDWIDSISMPKKKWDNLPEEEKKNYLPTGILKQDTEAPEYCDMYKEIQKAQQGQRGKLTQDDFTKKI
jgi:2-oxoglutarate ferredoxin oxidoreductase subunit beta